MEDASRSPGYTISCENPDFQNKLHDVFSGIDACSSNMTSTDSAIESGGEELYQDEETISHGLPTVSREFVKPPKPDFLINPSHYTKYSLRDTELSDNKANSQIAFQFLQERIQRKVSAPVEDENAELMSAKKHVFKMPEHAAGVPQSKSKDKAEMKDAVKAEIIPCDKVELEHLEENISAAEYTSEIAAKFDDEKLAKLQFAQPPKNSPPKEEFKSITKKKTRNLRNKSKEEE